MIICYIFIRKYNYREKEERRNGRAHDPKFERIIEQGKIYFKNS
jgi:hypothetical protein